MDKVSVCPDPSASRSSLSEFQSLQALQIGPSVASASTRELISAYGLFRVLRSLFARYLYIVRLWLLRETSILAVLTENYKKVPRRSLSKILVGVLYYSKLAKRLNASLLVSLKRKLTTNPYQVTKTVNKAV